MKPCVENVSDLLPINNRVSAVQLGRKPFAETTWFLHPFYGVDDIRFESLPPPEIPRYVRGRLH